MKPSSLYVHVPFCARRCSYCDFAVEATRDAPVDAWLEAVRTELALTAAERGWDGPLELETLYVGGGTPSLLGTGAMQRFVDVIAPHAVLTPGAEWTCEANPESFPLELALDWRAAGVTRLSLGAQTFDARALRWMGRLHGPDGPGEALAAARRAGFDNVSIDLIFGLPARLMRDWAADLDQALELEPDHVSLYGLTAEPGAPLGRWVTEGREALADEDRYADEYLAAHDRLTRAGFEHYEVSNFGRPGARSRHNFVYWSGAPYVALGPGAHAYFPPRRRWNLRSWSAYSDALRADRLPIEDEEYVDADASDLERIWLGLRTDGGYAMSGASAPQRDLVRRWTCNDLATLDANTVRLTAAGWLLLDRLALELHEAGAPAARPESIDGAASASQIAANPNPSCG
ncbi:MAG: radical SAM family heme chaperone HemW [Gemmatimonadota bacterium]